MYILIAETQFHRRLRQIEVVLYKCENGYGYGYPGYPSRISISYPFTSLAASPSGMWIASSAGPLVTPSVCWSFGSPAG